MSILCLICKEKLLSYAPGSSVGSLNQLAENTIIATACGHLYHLECLQSWFRTQKRKLQIQGYPEGQFNICPSCQSLVKEEDNRRIHPLEDHREALDKARLLERQENLEIYCHQLEIQLQQLQRENDTLLNKILTPPPSPMDDYETIVKNDRVVWIRKGDLPVSGVVLSIFKKEGKLCAKIKLDRKIRSNQRTNRILSSFRLDKKQELTVPFDEIALEKDVNQNVSSSRNGNGTHQLPGSNGINPGLGGKSLSSANIYHSFGIRGIQDNLRNSTLSLPDESRRLFGIQEAMDENSHAEISHAALNSKIINLNRSVSYSPGYPMGSTSSVTPEPPSREVSSPQSINSSNVSLDQQRDYVFITPSWIKNQQQGKSNNKSFEGRSSPPDGKNKHVTFADDPSPSKPFPEVDDRYANHPGGITERLKAEENNVPDRRSESPLKTISVVPKPRKSAAPPPPPVALRPKPRPRLSLTDSEESSASNNTEIQSPQIYNSTDFNILENGSSSNSNLQDQIPEFQLSVYETITKKNVPISLQDFQDSTDADDYAELVDFEEIPAAEEDSSCFDVTLLSLLYRSNGFDHPMLVDNRQDNEFCRKVKWIIREKFATPLRQFGAVQNDYSNTLKESVSHLCSGILDVEELLTILFEFTYKMSPFINYSLDMCDYLHQFFIDFTDKSKTQTVQQLLEKSLRLQDNLKLEGEPNPALVLQMPHSEDGVIHYDAVIPSLTLTIDHLQEHGVSEINRKQCYCNNQATLECKVCTDAHGSSAILFCENCKALLEEIHKENDHELKISPITQGLRLPSSMLALSSIVCWKDGRYTVFLKDGTDTYSPWVYVHAIMDGKLQMKKLPGFGYWLESLVDKSTPPDLQNTPSLLRKVLKHCRVFFYVPQRSSEV